MSAIRVTRHLYRLSWVDLSLSTGSSKEKTKKNYHSLLKTPIYISSLSLFRVRYRVWLVTLDFGEERRGEVVALAGSLGQRRREDVGTPARSLGRRVGGEKVWALRLDPFAGKSEARWVPEAWCGERADHLWILAGIWLPNTASSDFVLRWSRARRNRQILEFYIRFGVVLHNSNLLCLKQSVMDSANSDTANK
jgi:hypothetical protein